MREGKRASRESSAVTHAAQAVIEADINARVYRFRVRLLAAQPRVVKRGEFARKRVESVELLRGL